MMNKKILNGITWAHSRGITPLLATAQRFSELHPEVEIVWKKRSLQEFADFPIEDLTKNYDLLVIDHPWVGCAAEKGCVLPLNEYMTSAYLDNQSNNSVGNSFNSYLYAGHQWAIPIDAATPVSSYRKDLLDKYDQLLPQSWEQVIAMAKMGKVAIPGVPVDLLMYFYMFCLACGEEPFLNEEIVVTGQTGLQALTAMKELWSLVDPKMFHCNPITIAELMTTTDDFFYCPFAYGYSNYARVGFAKNILHYSTLPSFSGTAFRSTLGGTGLSVSAFSHNKETALQFSEWVASGDIQSTIYVEHGGQPGHLSAWVSDAVNKNCNNFFLNTLPTLKDAYTRPRYYGYLYFQDMAGLPIQQFLMGETNEKHTLAAINNIFKESKNFHP